MSLIMDDEHGGGIIFEQPSLLKDLDQKAFLTETGVQDEDWLSSGGQKNENRTRKSRSRDSAIRSRRERNDNTQSLRDRGLISHAALLQQKASDMRDVEMSLAEMKRTMKQREEIWKRQEASLQQKREELRIRIQEMEDFVRRSKSKVDKFRQKADEDRKAGQQLEIQLKERQEEFKRLEHRRNILTLELDHYRKYQDYLISVYKHDRISYSDIERILERYEILVSAVRDMEVMRSELKRQCVEHRELIRKTRQEGQSCTFELNALYSQKTKELEELHHHLASKSMSARNAQIDKIQKNREYHMLCMSIQNLYSRCLNTRKLKGKSMLNIADKESNPQVVQLALIANRIAEMSCLGSNEEETQNKTRDPRERNRKK